jgi:uncharacterized protein YkwD
MALESRWIFFFFFSIVSILSSFIPFRVKGEEVNVTLSQLPITTAQSATQTLAASKNKNGFIYQIAQLEIGQGRYVRKQIKVTPTPTPSTQEAPVEYGKAKQIDEHTWTMTVKNDAKEGSAGEIFTALNNYRTQKGKSQLIWNDTLSAYATSRANEFSQRGALDGHAGFLNFMNHEDGFSKLGFNSLGENSSFGYILSGTHLIEWVYAGDAEHDNNQLNSEWTYVGIGVSGTATDLIFGGKKR